MIAVTIVEYILLGVFAGTLAGLLGIGGAILIVPGLFYIFKTQTAIPQASVMHFVVGTSFATTIVTILFSLRAQYRRGTVSWPLFVKFFPGVLIGAVAGAVLAGFLHSHVLRILFGVFMILVAAQTFFRFRERQEPGFPSRINRWLAAIFIGIVSGLLGISGGALTIPYLSYYQVPIRQAMGVSTACGVVITITGAISFMIVGLHDASTAAVAWSTGYVYWPAVIVITSSTPWFTSLGAAWSQRLHVDRLRHIFAAFLLVVGLDMLLH